MTFVTSKEDMSSAKTNAQRSGDAPGWSDKTLLELAYQFIDDRGLGDRFGQFLDEIAEEEEDRFG